MMFVVCACLQYQCWQGAITEFIRRHMPTAESVTARNNEAIKQQVNHAQAVLEANSKPILFMPKYVSLFVGVD